MTMSTVCEENQCAGCMACVEICPKNAVCMEDTMDACNAVVDESKCIHCGACERICPNLIQCELKKPLSWCQGWAEEEETRRSSSSGGVCASLIRWFAQRYGTVCACVFREGQFVFAFSDELEDVSLYAGSKYVKSNPLGVYKGIVERLRRGEKVLFVGLPCQVAAVRNAVRPRMESGLYTIDLICHGSPSPLLLERYLEERKKDIARISAIDFREKTRFGLRCDGKYVVSKRVKDMYTCAFLSGLDYTDNCYSCRYAQSKRLGDITLGDAWGSSLVAEEQRKGISLILCQTEKGEKLVKEAPLHLEKIDIERAREANHQLNGPSTLHSKRRIFFEAIRKGNSFEKAVAKSMPKIYGKEMTKEILSKLKLLPKQKGE